MRPDKQIKVLENSGVDNNFSDKLKKSDSFPLKSSNIEILQMNVGKKCNLSCKHCHVEAGPNRTEMMSTEIFKKCLEIIKNPSITTVDLTGGAPEMNENLDWFIKDVSRLKKRLIIRSNLIILLEDEYSHFVDLYTKYGVELVASLPDYRKIKSNIQRGGDSFEKSIKVIKNLNNLGYGIPGSKLYLNLVHNPVGAYLPGTQSSLEFEYKRVLRDEFDIQFNTLFCLSNCPVGRYLEFLIRTDNFNDYMSLLSQAFNPSAANNVMCRTTLSVGYDGSLYDCDFNQMLDLPVSQDAPANINNFDIEKLKNREIVINNHCFACTAGAGSSCQGSLE